MKYKLTVTVALWMMVCISIPAQLHAQARKLTLAEAIELGLQNSKQLKTNEARILEATNAVTEAKEKQFPDGNISASYLYLPVKPNIDLKTGSGGSGGGANVSQAIYGSVNISLPLYSAGKLKYGIESAKFLEQAVKLDAENNRGLVIMNITNACINLYKAKEAITLVKENLAQSQQRVKDLSNLEKNGLLPRNDLLKAELQSSNTELTLLDAESNFKLACVNMNIMIGWPEQTEIIPDRQGLTLPESISTLEEYENEALQKRKDAAALAFRKKAAKTGIQIAKADQYPGIALTGGYLAADIPKFLTITNAVNIGIGVKYNFSSLWKTNTRMQQARINLQQLDINGGMLDDNIRLQVNQAYQAYLVSVKKIEVYEKAVIQASENYRITKNKYDNALATVTEVLDADVALLQTKLSVTNAKADSFLAYNRLLLAAGLLNK
jgi:outer membrane protein